MSKRFELEQLYFQAKEAYYSGETIMTDDEFDSLEQELIALGSTAPHIVGADDRKAKYSHPSPMLSLAKYQASLAGVPPTGAAINWMSKFGATSFEITPKYDGNAGNAIYQDGKLLQVLSRGNGTKGRDITDKVKHNLPEPIDLKGTVEIRGEVVIKISTFNEKYSHFKNPRNYVAGVLNRDDNNQSVLDDLCFLPVEVRTQIDEQIVYPNLNDFLCTEWDGYTVPYYTYTAPDNFEYIYELLTRYRAEESPYQLDGFVIKAPEGLRPTWGENSHDPNWAIAIKFPPKEATTKIKSISWQYGKTGELTPVAVMEPVDLDGSTVSRAALFNLGYLKEKGAYPGATVTVAKSGDIIPQIQRVLAPGNIAEFQHPDTCKCGNKLSVKGIHLICESTTCNVKAWFKFYTGVSLLGLDGVGGAITKQIWKAGVTNAIDLLIPNKFNKEMLIKSGEFKAGKTLDNIFKELAKCKDLRPKDIILLMGVEGMGHTTAKQLGNYISGLPHNFSGLQKDIISGFGPGEIRRQEYEMMVESITPYINIILPEKISEDSISFEMTGSPKAFGFSTKDEFLKLAKEKGYHHAGLKDAKVLFVDDINSSSSKMKTATAKGIKIMLYNEI
jgi:DNA ligase (NAD+)